MVITNSLLCPCAGVLLALVSGILFTTNNFLVSLYRVRPGHLVLVRSLAQVMVFTSVSLYRRESLLPGPLRQKMFILLQGTQSDHIMYNVTPCDQEPRLASCSAAPSPASP